MLWIYDHYKYFTLTVRGWTLDVCGRQILTTKGDPHAVRVNRQSRLYSVYICFISPLSIPPFKVVKDKT